MTELFETRIKVTDEVQKFRMSSTAGLMEAVDLLEKLPPTLSATPGMALAIATISAEAHQNRAGITSTNLKSIAAAGHDINSFSEITYDPIMCGLICKHVEA